MTERGGGRGQAALVQDDVEFDATDATLLRAIARTGSVAKAASDLGRSRARALDRLESLEAAFGELVKRRRGGSGGGGSTLTGHGAAVLDRFERLAVAVTATARVPETVLRGTVSSVNGELAVVDTPVGEIGGIHDGVETGERAQVRVGADALTVFDADADPPPDATSARNRRQGTVSDVDPGETVRTLAIDVGGTRFRVLVTEDSATRLDLEPGTAVTITWKATATRLVPESR